MEHKGFAFNLGAVEIIVQKRKTNMCKVNSYLVGSSCVEKNFDNPSAVFFVKGFVFGRGGRPHGWGYSMAMV